jgi:hypothetical protein
MAMSVQYSRNLYYVRSEGAGFLKYLSSLVPSSTSF